VPLQDWPVFTGFSYIIAHLSHFSSFSVKPIPPPNTTGFLLLAGLMKVFPPLVAGKLLLSLYVVGFLGAFCYFLLVLNPKGLFLYFFAPLLTFNYFFAKGNINFILSLPLFLFSVAFILPKIEKHGWRTIVITFLLSLTLYFTHLFTYCAFLLVLLVFVICRKRGMYLFAAAVVPACLCMTYFITNRAPLELEFYKSFAVKFISFRDTFGTWTPYLDVALLSIPFIALLVLVVRGWKNTELAWKIILASFLVLFILSPMEVYTLVRADQRFLPFMFFVLLVFPNYKNNLRFSKLLVALLVILSLANFTIKEIGFLSLQPRMERCITALSMVPENKSVVSMGTKEYYIGVINPFLHIIAYEVSLKGNANIPPYDWKAPVYYTERFPVPVINEGIIKNKYELCAFYDFFFLMEESTTMESQIQDFAELVFIDNETKLFKRK